MSVSYNDTFDESSGRGLLGGVPRQRTRDMQSITLSELLPARSAHRPHVRRLPVIIDDEPVEETLRERLERELEELTTAASQIISQLDRRTKQVEQLKMYPENDPFGDDEVLRFDKTFPRSTQAYSYTASKIKGFWYVSGSKSPQAVTWAELVDWMGLGVEAIYRVRTGRKVIGVGMAPKS